MNIIFLDIDGVLNSVDSAVAYHALHALHALHPKNYFEDETLDMISVGLLKALCDETDAKIVISSVWRMGRTPKDFIEIFDRYDWQNTPVICTTPILGTKRGYEIQEWLDSHPEVTNYVILDDDSDMLDSQLQNFVHVSNVNGFRSKHYCKCLRIFGQPDERLEQQVNFVRKSNNGE